MNINTSGFVTPAEVYEDAMLRPEPTPQELEETRGQLLAYDDLMRVSMEKVRSRTHSDLDDVHSQTLPAVVEFHSMDVPIQSNQVILHHYHHHRARKKKKKKKKKRKK